MIVVRDIFYLKFGNAKPAKELIKEIFAISNKIGITPGRVLTDLTGRSYRLILELNFKNLTEMENSMKSVMGNPEWAEWYKKFVPLIDSAEREILTVFEV